MTPKTIIVPLDGSPLAEAALPPGVALSAAFDADVLAVRATWHRPPEEEARYLDDIVRRFDTVTIHPCVVHGFATIGVADLVTGAPDPVLCLTTRGHTGLIGELLLGSVAAELIDSTRVPMVLIGPACRPVPTTWPVPDRTLLLCFDASEAARRLEATVIEWATRFGLRVEVVTVLHRDGEFLGEIASGAVRAAAADFVDRLEAHGLSGRHVVLDGIDPARAVLQHAKETRPALIAAGATAARTSRGVARFSRAVLGSTAERLVRHASVPVLVAQP